MNTGVLYHQVANNVKKHRKNNNLLKCIRGARLFTPILGELDSLLDPSTFVGRAPQQVEKFTSIELKNALKLYKASLAKGETCTLHVCFAYNGGLDVCTYTSSIDHLTQSTYKRTWSEEQTQGYRHLLMRYENHQKGKKKGLFFWADKYIDCIN